MSEAKPVRRALGYVRRYPGQSPAAAARLRQQVIECAHSNGYDLIGVHVEELDTDPSAFFHLVAAIATTGAHAVVVPTAAHLGHEVINGSKLAHLRRTTEVQVLVSDQRTS